ncbi:MAG: HD domain-containing protein [Thermomicrobiales bacterium]
MIAVAVASRLAYRIGQVRGYLVDNNPPVVPQSVLALLLPGTIKVFRQLPAGEQRHLLAVHGLLLEQAASEDLLRAGLLHDLGKVYNGQRIDLASRCLKVVMNTVAPELLTWISQHPAPPWWGTGLWIAGNHARIGAKFLKEPGYSTHVCWLVAHHEKANAQDIDLAQLTAADNSRMAIPRR